MNYSSVPSELAEQLCNEATGNKMMSANVGAGGFISIITTLITFLQSTGWDLAKIIDFVKQIIGLFHKSSTEPSSPQLP